MTIVNMIKVILKNLDKEIELDNYLFPKLKQKGGIRKVTLSKIIYRKLRRYP